MRTLVIFFGIVLSSTGLWASECSNPRAAWLLSSCWETALGSSSNAILDGGKWDEWHVALSDDSMAVVNNPPVGGPGTNALKMHYSAHPDPTSMTGNDSYMIVMAGAGRKNAWLGTTNPIYLRSYWYSTWPADVWGGGQYMGRKFYYYHSTNQTSAFVLGLYSYHQGGTQDGLMKLVMKNHTFDNEFYNQKNSEHLDGSFAWPGKQDDGLIEPNKWYCIELGIYIHPTQGFLKIWKDGKLVINANKDVPGWGGTYDTSIGGYPLQDVFIPAARNGSTDFANDEYWEDVIMSSSPIGCVGSIPPPPPPPSVPNAPTGLRTLP